MTWKQFVSWQEYDRMDPIGGPRLDWLAASIVSTFVNVHRNRDKFPNPFPIADFVLKWGEDVPKDLKLPPPTQKSWQQLKAIGQMCASMFNAIEDSDAKKRKKRKAA